MLWHRGRCLSYGDGVAFWALAEMVRMRARITEDDSPPEALRRLDAMLAEHVPDAEDRAWITPALHQLLGLEATADGDRARLFAAWRLLFERLAATSPAVLVFEDLQWADQALLDFLEYLMEWSRDHRLFVIALARPELADARPAWGSGLRTHTSMALKPLGEEDMRTVVEGMAPGIPADAVEPIVAAVGGDPAVCRRDRAHAARPGPAGTPTTASSARPATSASWRSRRRCMPWSRPAWTRWPRASAGRCSRRPCWASRSPREGLAAISGLDADEVDRTLASLARKELVCRDSDPFSPDLGQFGFVQAIARTDRLRDALPPRPQGDAPGRRPSSSPSWETATSWPRWWRRTGWTPTGCCPTTPDAARSATAPPQLWNGRPRRPPSLGAPREALRLRGRLLELTDEPHERARLLELAGEYAAKDDRLERSSELYSEALALRQSWGDAEAPRWRRSNLPSGRWMMRRVGAVGRRRWSRPMRCCAAASRRQVWQRWPPSSDASAAFMGRTPTTSSKPLDHALRIAAALDLPDVMSEALNSKGHAASAARAPHCAKAGCWSRARWPSPGSGTSSARSCGRCSTSGSSTRCWTSSAARTTETGSSWPAGSATSGWTRSFLAHLAQTDFVSGDWDTSLDRAAQLRDGPGSDANVLVQSAALFPTAAVLAARGDAAGARALIASVPDRERAADVQDRGMWCVPWPTSRLTSATHIRAIELGRRPCGLSELARVRPSGRQARADACADAAIALDDRETLELLAAGSPTAPPGHRPPLDARAAGQADGGART